MALVKNAKPSIEGSLPSYLLPPRELLCYVNYVRYPEDEFETVKVLAKAIHGSVLLAIHKPTNCQVAIKKLNNSSFANISPQLLEHPLKEIGALRFLSFFWDSEFICQLYEVYRDDNYTYLVSEYAERGELFNIVSKRENLLESEARIVVHQIIRSVKSIHDAGLCHRDISLENILVHENGSVRLSDFGQCLPCYTLDGKPNFFQGIAGKMSYRTPEMLTGEFYNGQYSDVFSIGILMFIILAGGPPWKSPDDNDNRYVLIQTKGTYSLLKKWQRQDRASKMACSLIDAILRRNPNERPTVNQILQHEWFKQEGFRSVSWRKAKTIRPYFTEYDFLEKPMDDLSRLYTKRGISSRKSETSVGLNSPSLFSFESTNLDEIRYSKTKISFDRSKSMNENTVSDEEESAVIGEEYDFFDNDKVTDPSIEKIPFILRNKSIQLPSSLFEGVGNRKKK